jgi:photosystem II stability/assembly factor-like uncharacterized protein
MRNALFILGLVAAPTARAQDTSTAKLFSDLHYRYIGPPGNRAIAVAGVPGDPMVAFVGAASGGVWRTTDGGNSWKPVFDEQPVQSVGSLAIAHSQPNIIWAGTGETFMIRAYHALGNGVYRSDDMGTTWRHLGLDATGRIGRVVIHPTNPDIVYACALGHAHGPQKERGVYRTRDGGKTWDQVLMVDENTGCSDLAMDANDPQTLFAGTWQVDFKQWSLNSGGTGSGVYVTHDGGTVWKKLTGHGLPAANHPLGKVAVAIAPSNSPRVYALIEDSTPGLYRSDDGGINWRLVNRNHILNERSPYYTRMGVSPTDPNHLYFPCVSWSVSLDGGETLANTEASPGGDNHDVWIDPLNPKRVMVANDGGAAISLNGGQTYDRVTLPIAQVYHVHTDNQIPYFVYGNRQDGPAYRGPSNTLGGRLISPAEWGTIGGCEDGFAIPDPADNDINWSGCYAAQLDRMNVKTGQVRSVDVWPDAAYGWKPADVKYRFHWVFPIAISPHDHNRVYVGSQVVHVSTDGGQSWQVISPDLTTNDPSRKQSSGGMTVDNLMTFNGATLSAVAESPVQKGVIWTGSWDGQVNITKDNGAHWENVTKGLVGMPALGKISNVEPSRFDAATAYLSADLQYNGNFDPFIYRTSDYGKTWKAIGAGIPKSQSSFVHVVREDPGRKGMLYAGTDNALYLSWDDGANWMPLQNNLPHAPVDWLTIQERYNDLVVGTHGRGFWILDDITPLRNFDAKARAADAYLFPLRDTYRYRRIAGGPGGGFEGGASNAGHNPPDGADVNYYLKAAGDSVRIVVLGSAGDTVRNMRAPGKAGVNRVWWNLSYDPAHPVRLRTAPVGSPWVPLGPQGYRPLISWTSRGDLAPSTAPGTYTVKLVAAGGEQAQTLKVLRDPASIGTDAGLQAETSFLLEARNEVNQVADMINDLEWTRRHLQDIATQFHEDKNAATVVKATRDLEQKATAMENELEDVTLTGRSEDSFRAPMGIHGKLAFLASAVMGSGSDLPPTNQQVEVNTVLKGRIADVAARYRLLKDKDIPALNEQLKAVAAPLVP